MMIKVGVVGYGYWGPNLARNFAEASGAQLRAVCDLRPAMLVLAHSSYLGIKTTTNYHELLADTSIDAIAIATPASSHFALAMQALQAGKHVLVEKPLATTSWQASQLIDEAERCARVLMVDHTFVYTGAVRKMRELVARDELGEIYYYD